MRHVRPAIDEAEARRRVIEHGRGLVQRIARLISPPGPVTKVERVWLPVYLVTIPLDSAGVASETSCSIEGLSGSFAIFEMNAALCDGEPEGERFPPILDPETAERMARASLLTAILRRRGRAGKPVPGPTKSVELLRWPYWVFYHRGRGGRIDIRLVDAATGDQPGHKIKLGLLDAFRAAAARSAES